jgi:hypothetical protein
MSIENIEIIKVGYNDFVEIGYPCLPSPLPSLPPNNCKIVQVASASITVARNIPTATPFFQPPSEQIEKTL